MQDLGRTCPPLGAGIQEARPNEQAARQATRPLFLNLAVTLAELALPLPYPTWPTPKTRVACGRRENHDT